MTKKQTELVYGDTDIKFSIRPKEFRALPAPQRVRVVLEHIEANRKHFDMSTFVARWAIGEKCGTTLCVAGWANVLAGHTRHDDTDNAMDLLGLDNDRLFYTSDDFALEELERLAASEVSKSEEKKE